MSLATNSDPVYPDAKSKSSYQDGMEFQDFICERLARHHIILQNIASRKFQFEVGENLQGFEIKLDRRCLETGRLSIEVAEKTAAANSFWVPSGIMREDNSWLYIQGNYQIVFIFAKKLLRDYLRKKKPKIDESLGTVQKFYLPLDVARHLAARVIEGKGLGPTP